MAEKLGLDQVVNPLHAIRLDCLLEGALAAFDCDLIANYEERQAWWWISKVAKSRVELGMVDWGHTWAKLWSAVADMMFIVSPSSLLPRV
jgi:predicted cobalt transporter CbtA